MWDGPVEMHQTNKKGVSCGGRKDKVEDFVFVRLLCFDTSCLWDISVQINVDKGKTDQVRDEGAGRWSVSFAEREQEKLGSRR